MMHILERTPVMLVRLLFILLLAVDITTGLAQPSINRRDAIVQSATMAAGGLTALGIPGILPAGASYIDPSTDMPKITNRVFLDVQITNGAQARLVIGLFGDVMPKVTENFVALCKDNGYAGTSFYRVISGVTVQGGAIGADQKTGKTGTSSFGTLFEPDNFSIKHSTEGLVSMVRDISGGVDSRFFINVAQDAGWADDRYAAFGIGKEFIVLS